jgi:hypothetical protein
MNAKATANVKFILPARARAPAAINRGSSRDRQTHRLEQHPPEQHSVAVPNQEVGRLLHAGDSAALSGVYA